MPTKRIYIDSRFRMPGGSDSDFRYALRTPIELARGTIGWIDGVVLSQSFGNIIAGYNDTLYLRELTATFKDHIITIIPGDYNIYTLATEIETQLNLVKTLTDPYVITPASGSLTFSNASPTGSGHILTLEMIQANDLLPAWGDTTTPTPAALSDKADACRLIGNMTGTAGPIGLNSPLTMAHVDLMPYRQLFLHSHIGAPTSQGPRGENTIVRRIIVDGAPGSLITDFHNTQMDYIDLGEQLSTLHFSLRDIHGNVVDTDGHPVSFALCLS